jgi:hypothetical protein
MSMHMGIMSRQIAEARSVAASGRAEVDEKSLKAIGLKIKNPCQLAS